MARGINKVILVGNIGQDPEVRFMPSGGAVCNLSLATSESWKDKQTGQPQERTEWHRLVFYNRLAEIVGQYVRKGSKLYVEGSLRSRKWQDQEGQEKMAVEIIVNDMQMLDSRGQMGGVPMDQQAGSFGGYSNYAQQPAAPGVAQAPQQTPLQQPITPSPVTPSPVIPSPAASLPAASVSEPALTDFDDDIPF